MSSPVISVRGLGKRYQISGRGSHDTLRDHLAHGAKALFHRVAGGKAGDGGDSGEFWALRDVSFDVQQGEVMGVIGRNGAGKSTLLKILSQITDPTTGEIRVRGRVASLLEVGTGFHLELSGRENVYLNGAILGMTKAEIKKKFDEIVAFADVEKFLDMPVKRYSSGMYMRLAFAVAAHLDPEILVVDEVLAVGDAEFQKKCLGKMQDVSARDGRTVLFVSHNMAAIQQLCSKIVLLEGGEVKFQGGVQAAIEAYLGDNRPASDGMVDLSDWKARKGVEHVKIKALKFLTLGGAQKSEFLMGEPVQLCIEVVFDREVVEPDVGFALLTSHKQPLFASALSDCGPVKNAGPGTMIYSASIDPCQLMPGAYRFALVVMRKGGDVYDFVDEVPGFTVLPIPSENSIQPDLRWGSLFFKFPWRVEPVTK